MSFISLKNSYTGISHLNSFPLEDTRTGGSSKPVYGRVVDVILDSTHPRYDSLGKSQALYGVFYQPIFEGAVEDLKNSYGTRFAYCKQNSLRQIPVRNEIVQLEVGPAGAQIQNRDDEGYKYNVYQEKVYWTAIVPVWNHPHLNIYPDVNLYEQGIEEATSLGDGFEENDSIRPLQLTSGDVVLEGRHGQSLRFGGSKYTNGIEGLSTEESNGKPYTILRNGQADTEGNVCIEDINEDCASIYLTSDHSVPLLEANHKFAAARENIPLEKDYRGKQIVANADQVFVNARKDNLGLAAKQHLSVNAKSVSMDGEDYLGLDASKIYLGSDAKSEKNPVLKGQVTVEFLSEVLNNILKLLDVAGKVDEPFVWVSKVAGMSEITKAALKGILAGIGNLKSEKVYTE